MLYDNSTPALSRSQDVDLLRITLSEVDGSYTWSQIKEALQEQVFPHCKKFGTWSSDEKRVD